MTNVPEARLFSSPRRLRLVVLSERICFLLEDKQISNWRTFYLYAKRMLLEKPYVTLVT